MGIERDELRELEIEKMRLEIADKRRSFLKRLEFWKFVFFAMGILGGFLVVISQLNNLSNEAAKHVIAMERADLNRDKAEFERERAVADREVEKRRAMKLQAENDIAALAEKEMRDQLTEMQARLEAAEASEKAVRRTVMKLQSVIDAQISEDSPPDGDYVEIAGLVTDYSGSPVSGILVKIGKTKEETGPNGIYLARIAREATNVQVEFYCGAFLLGASSTSGAADSIVNCVVPKEAVSLSAARSNYLVKRREANAKSTSVQRRLAQSWGNNELVEMVSKGSYLRSWFQNAQGTRAGLHEDISSFVNKYGDTELAGF